MHIFRKIPFTIALKNYIHLNMYIVLFSNINPVAINSSYFTIYWYGITYAVAICLGTYLIKNIERRHKITHLDYKDLESLLLYIVIGVIIGGRLGYILFYTPGIIFYNFLETLKIWHGGMSFHGGLLGITISLLIFCGQRSKKILPISDLIAYIAPLGLFFGRCANFINGELYGKRTNGSWGVIFPHYDYQLRHPSQLYEALLEGIMLFFIMIKISRIRTNNSNIAPQRNTQLDGTGLLSTIFLVFYSVFRIIIEIFREPDAHIGYLITLTLGQILCIPMFLLGISIAALLLQLFAYKKTELLHNSKK